MGNSNKLNIADMKTLLIVPIGCKGVLRETTGFALFMPSIGLSTF